MPRTEALSRSTQNQARVRRVPHSERHLQLLEAARAIIRSDGVGSLTMSRLADAVGVTKPIVYKHFRNSEDVIIEILEQYVRGSIDIAADYVKNASTIFEFMDGIIESFFKYARSEGTIIRSITNGFSFSDAVNACFLETQDRSLRIYRHLLLQQNVPERKASVAAYAMLEMINSTILEFAPDSTADDENMLKEMVRGALSVLVDGRGSKPHVPAHILNLKE